MISVRVIAAAAAASLACGGSSPAPPPPPPGGSLDPSFGRAGVVSSPGASAAGLVLDASGRLDVVGASQGCLGVWRFSGSGAPDATFADGGVRLDDGFSAAPVQGCVGNYPAGAAVALDGGGKLVVAGHLDAEYGDYRMYVWRFAPDGSLDAGFGQSGRYDGFASVDQEGEGDAVALDAQGRIVIAGRYFPRTIPSPSSIAAVWRLTPAGTLDASFGGSGIVEQEGAQGAGGHAFAYGVAVDGSGRIVVAGCRSTEAGDLDVALWRYRDDGTLDPAFGAGGLATRAATGDDCAAGVAIDGQGHIAVAGYATSARGDRDLAVWRFGEDGAPDATFAGAGLVTHDGGGGAAGADEGARAIALDAAGRLVIAGSGKDGAGRGVMVVWRYGADGALDRSFDGDGVAAFPGPDAGDARGMAVRLDAAGRIVVAGAAGTDAAPELAVWRILP